ncbi:protein kinase, putative [Trypanosoma brucei gambiense DAL972]|uniref:non-specific serine/threonine protein kinase n=1 Tax=Trypanosoma brucei gambiense (strain MHOM/CI/86/DAL972) TaxID=679716 RepID=C9ZZX0_TRYB9|nr:protein kinase, putative [Trypanosoma brucei gambiense DAL972]CBH16528.1 protein kinase, putative [Trypanosoma brucei gambiense DAL972]|eukprot:XP_011778792.1 protein kinase, putative [Trypanosoma brucei gambiense DAL972]
MENFVLPPYTVSQKLGSGTFSTVRLATDEQRRRWAVKIIDKAKLRKEEMEGQLMREVEAMRVFKHENIIAFHDFKETPTHYCLVLEFVSGGELFDKIVAAKRFDEPTARRYFQQLIAGVHHCHGKGFAHRDLKPENLLLDAVGVLKISDFGLGNRQQDILLKTVCGTPNYVAPEVLMERGYNGLCADIWSCGVILYVMLAGKLPFEDRNQKSLLEKVKRGEYAMLRQVSEAVRDLVKRMLTVDPQNRITLEAIISHPWFAVGWDPKCLKEAA